RSHLIHPLLERLAGPPTTAHPFPVRRLDPTCRLRGWRVLATRVDQVRAGLRAQGEKDPVLAGVSWSVPGELGVYCAGHPQAYHLGLVQGDRHVQYACWLNPIDQPEPFHGQTFLVVGPVSRRLAAGFNKIDPPITVTYQEGGRTLASWTLHVCHGFKGFPALAVPPAH